MRVALRVVEGGRDAVLEHLRDDVLEAVGLGARAQHRPDQLSGGEMQRVATHWLRDFGVDGFRMDAVRYLVEDGAHVAAGVSLSRAVVWPDAVVRSSDHDVILFGGERLSAV